MAVNAQTFDWVATTGGTGTDNGITSTYDENGNVFTIGTYNSTVDVDPGAGVANFTAPAGGTSFLRKTDANGNFIWALSFEGTGWVRGNSITLDFYGNIYICGAFGGTPDFDPGIGTTTLTSAGFLPQGFVMKLDASGTFQWVKEISGSPTSVEPKSVLIMGGLTPQIYTTGIFSGTVDFDPNAGINNVTAVGATNSFIQKLNSSGNLVWIRTIGDGYVFAEGSHADNGGNIITAGTFSDSPDFDPGVGVSTITALGYDIFVQKMDTSGNFAWAKSIGGAGTTCNHVAVSSDPNNNVITTGWFSGVGSTIDLDPGVGTSSITNLGNEDAFVQKMDASGNFIWGKGIQGTGSEKGIALKVDPNGNTYTMGQFSGTVDFDPNGGVNSQTAAYYDCFIQKLDPTGNLIWVSKFGGSSSITSGNDLFITTLNEVYTTGSYAGIIDFDPNAGVTSLSSTGGGYDIFVQKLIECVPTSGTDVVNTCGSSYTWIDGITYNANTTSATHSLTNAGGCDSVVTLNLTFLPSYAYNDVIHSCVPITWINGLTYSENTFPLGGTSTVTYLLSAVNGCDSLIYLYLIIDSVEVTVINTDNTLTATLTGANYQWINCDGNTIINGETGQSFTPTFNGSYACIIDDATCVDTSACMVVSTIGISEIDALKFTIYPNPATTFITIESNEIIESVAIYDLSGKLIRTENTVTFSIENLSTGVYMLHINTVNGIARSRFIKE